MAESRIFDGSSWITITDEEHRNASDPHLQYLTTGRGDARYPLGTDPRLSDARTPTAHTHTASQVSDSTTTGRSLLTAVDAAAARTAIGLGSAATTASTAYATAAQGTKADGAAQKSANLSDLADAATARTNLGLDTAATVGALPIPDPGSFYPTDTITAALQLIGGRELYGTGSPEGVVTAPVGTYYTDTAITNGAMRWAKKTGTGNTGWAVVTGDTGWRAITSWTSGGVVTGQVLNAASWAPLAGSSGGIRVRRINNEVILGVRSLERLAVTDMSMWAAGYVLPAGFRPSAYAQGVVFHSGGTAAIQWGTDGSVGRGTGPQAGVNGSYASVAEVLVRAPALADVAWPTTLPGTAA